MYVILFFFNKIHFNVLISYIKLVKQYCKNYIHKLSRKKKNVFINIYKMDKTKIKLLSLIPSEMFYIILLLTQIGQFYKITIRNKSVHSLT